MTPEIKVYKPAVGFVPHRLDVKDRTEFDNFPRDVLFITYFNKGGIDYSATAFYKPDLETLQKEGIGKSLKYHNIYGPEGTVTITQLGDKWQGLKVVKDEITYYYEDEEWNRFFGFFTGPGLSRGESCFYERLEDVLKKVNQK